MRADRAAEELLNTLHQLLRRFGQGLGAPGPSAIGPPETGPPKTGPPVVPLLQRFVPLLQLQRGQASEEVRLHGLKCVDAALALLDRRQAPALCSETAAPLLGSMIAGLLRHVCC